MKYLITIPYEGPPKLIEYICDFFEIKGNFKHLKAFITIETKLDLFSLIKGQQVKAYNLPPEIRQLLNSIDINTLAD
jgi:hypothetical protein